MSSRFKIFFDFLMSLYRKYRPQSFGNLVGQEHIRTTLTNALKNQKVAHAYLFTGPRGTGKTSTARLMAKAINCQSLQNSEPCEKCDICRDISEGRLIDLIEIDAASNRGIDEIRDLREKINFAPTRAKNKVYIIDEVHMLTKEAFNALLKTLEEPPSHVYFILATTEVHKIPETILSRCQRFDFKRIDQKTLVDRLGFIAKEEKIEAENDALEAISRYAQGGLRDAIGLLEQLSVNGKLTFTRVNDVLGISKQASLENLFELLKKKDAVNALKELGALYDEGYDLNQFNKDFLEYLRQKMLVNSNLDVRTRTAAMTWILKMLENFQQSYEQMRFSTIPQLPLEVAIVQSCLEGALIQDTPITPSASPIPVERPHQNINSTAKIEVQIEPEEKKKPEFIEPTVSIDLTFDQIKKDWPKILNGLQNVIARRTVSMGFLVSLDGNVLRMTFQTQFHLEKIKETAVRMDIEKTLENHFKVSIKFVPELAQGIIRPVSTDAAAESAPIDETASQLLEMLGAELIQS